MSLNVIKLLNDYHVKYWTEGKNVSPGWVNVKCVFCEDSSNHLGWNIKDGYFNCWKCGKHKIDYTLSRILNLPKTQVNDIIFEYSFYGTQLNSLNKKQNYAKSVSLPGGKLNKYHIKYLKNRKFDVDFLVKKYELKGTGPIEFWNKINYSLRIIIPIVYKGKVISFQGRDITNKQKERYKGCPIEKSVVNYKHIFYNMDNVIDNKVVVVEGVVDVWRLGDGFIGSFGTSLTPQQIKLLNQYEEIFFLFDSEKEAQNKAKKYAFELSSIGKKVEVLQLDTQNDPGELPEEEVSFIRKEIFGG